jgi:hypothetical protein
MPIQPQNLKKLKKEEKKTKLCTCPTIAREIKNLKIEENIHVTLFFNNCWAGFLGGTSQVINININNGVPGRLSNARSVTMVNMPVILW